MGDMADLALEEVSDEEELRFSFRTGHISELEAFELGIINELGGEIGTEARLKTCRCCGENNLCWRKYKNKWRLFKDNKLHNCPKNKLKEIK